MDIKSILEYSLIYIGGFNFLVLNVVQIIILLVSLKLILWGIKKLLNKTKYEASRKHTVYQISKYFILVVGTIVLFDIIGINITVFLAGSAALLVGIGFGLQDLFRDFISGVILLVDRSIKLSDIIEVDGIIAQVQQINIRTTSVMTRDDQFIILPNSQITSQKVINWTHDDDITRFNIKVGVAYTSDVKLVLQLLVQATKEQNSVESIKQPFARFVEFGESSLNFIVYFWSRNVFRIEDTKSDIRVRIFELFSANGIIIPFPQRTLHFNDIDKLIK